MQGPSMWTGKFSLKAKPLEWREASRRTFGAAGSAR